jgi:Uroporphyrinogen-III decarboxylase
MTEDMTESFDKKSKRYLTAMKNEKPDRVPIRPFAAEFIAKYAGFTVQEVTHEYSKAFEATKKCAKDFQWDATIANMVFVWTGFVDHFGQKYYRIPGIDLPADMNFQYIEPPDEENAYMKEDEYDDFIESPMEFLLNIWLPRISKFAVPMGEPNTSRNNLAWLKGGMAMMEYLGEFGKATGEIIDETGCAPAIFGSYKAPFDILGDKLRGFRQVCADVYRFPDKVQAAVEAMAPHILQDALTSSDPLKTFPNVIWLHRGTLFSDLMYQRYFWPTLKYIIEELFKEGHQTLWYGEGDWSRWYNYTRQLPEKSIIYHVDKEDIFEAHRQLGDKFAISGGVPNDLLAYGSKEEVMNHCKKIFETVGKDGGYILDAGAIIQGDAKTENIQALTDAVMRYGIY